MRNKALAAGYSLLELLTVISILALTISLGSNLAPLVQRERNFRNVLDLQRLLQFARSEAVFQETPVTLCAIDTGGRCDRRWTGKQVAVFRDSNRNFQLDPGEALRLQQWPAERGELIWRASLGRDYLVFNRGGDTAQNGSFHLCWRARTLPADVIISINRGGRSYIREKRGKRWRSCA